MFAFVPKISIAHKLNLKCWKSQSVIYTTETFFSWVIRDQHNTTLTCFFTDCRYFYTIFSQKTLHESTTEKGLYKGESWTASTVILIFRRPL